VCPLVLIGKVAFGKMGLLEVSKISFWGWENL
jgi:hypothetical protein